ncbi:DUF1753-domain-containing protein [Dacryopinax primogenitus]|uniref:DUF1753-domain-containing protein n=1 Tax=Dacryopinax primogenitus (strain DJM 731) TaxID=1858805 RepID=M5G4Q8_DACPD|nr:DUF1753-domain-containing protein [Dacryopinax primogenitus]EJU03664.1 DUF1753-domain-containing protein [Dacryopinax primogenitus]
MWLRLSRPIWPLTSFVGLMDLKTGATVILLFALLNKVAGVYGLITIVTGGSIAQLSMYFYSIVMLVAIWWLGLRIILSENPRYTFWIAYAFLLDHVITTIWLAYFALEWWIWTPHDGRRVAHSAAQEALINSVAGHNMTDAERELAAQAIWDKEKGTAGGVVVISWLVKWYFIAIMFSYALRLRAGNYHSLPSSNVPLSSLPHPDPDTGFLSDEEDDLAREEMALQQIRSPTSAREPDTATSMGSFRTAPVRGIGNGTPLGSPYTASPGRTRFERNEVLWEQQGDEDRGQ